MEMQTQPQEPIYTGKLSASRWNAVLFALRRHAMPFEVSAPIIAELEQQLMAQQEAALSTEDMLKRTEGEAHDDPSGMPE